MVTIVNMVFKKQYMDSSRTTKSNPISLTRACGGRSGALSASKNKHGSSNLAGAREVMEKQGFRHNKIRTRSAASTGLGML